MPVLALYRSLRAHLVTALPCSSSDSMDMPSQPITSHHNLDKYIRSTPLLYRTCDVSSLSRDLIIYSPSFKLSFTSLGRYGGGLSHPSHQVYFYFITIGALLHQQVINDFFLTIPNTWFVVLSIKIIESSQAFILVFCACILQNLHSCSDFPEQASDSCLASCPITKTFNFRKETFLLFLPKEKL